jgi:hypothetical protein
MTMPTLPLPEREMRPVIPSASLRGRGHGGNPLVATATLLGESEGRLTLSADILSEAMRGARYGEDSWREVIVIAQSGPSALLLPMPPGIKMVGIVSEQEMPTGLTTPVPVLSGVQGAREQIAEGSIVLLDPVRGRVLVEPDPKEIAAIQANRHRARYRIGGDSIPAITQEGRIVSVYAIVRERSAIDEALLAGADGLFVPASADLLLPLAEEGYGDPLKTLLPLAEAFGGGDVTLALTAEMFAPLTLAAVAAVSLLRVALHPSDLPMPPTDIQYELEKIVQQETNAGRRAAVFGLAALGPDLESPETSAFDTIYLGAEVAAGLTPETLFALPPVYALFDNPFDDSLTGFAEVISVGVAGVVVPVGRVAESKDRIREME